MSKKYLAFVMLLVFALVLSACNQKATPEPTAVPSVEEPAAPAAEEPAAEEPAAEEPAAEAPAAEEPAAEPPAAEEPVEASDGIAVPSRADGYNGPALTTDEITISIIRPDNGPEEDDLLHARFDEFTAAHPNIKITEEVVPFSQLGEKIQASVAAGAAPDIIYYDGPYTKTYANFNILLPLNDYLTDDFINDYAAATLAEHSYEGKVYGMPLRQSALVMFYNKAMAAEAGVTFPEEVESAMTFDEARTAWEKLAQDPSGSGNPTVWGLAPSAYGAGGPAFYYFDGIFIRSMGDKNADPESSAYKTYAAVSPDGTDVEGYVNTDEAVAGMEWYAKLYSDGVVSKVGIPGAFLDQKAATYIADDWAIGDLNGLTDDAKFDYGVSPIPYFKTQLTHTGSDTWGVSATTKHPAEATALLVYLHNIENLEKYWDLTRGMPARMSLYNSLEAYSEQPYKMFADELAKIAEPRPSIPGWGEYEVVMNEAIKNIAYGADAREMLNDAAKRLNEQLAKYK